MRIGNKSINQASSQRQPSTCDDILCAHGRASKPVDHHDITAGAEEYANLKSARKIVVHPATPENARPITYLCLSLATAGKANRYLSVTVTGCWVPNQQYCLHRGLCQTTRLTMATYAIVNLRMDHIDRVFGRSFG